MKTMLKGYMNFSACANAWAERSRLRRGALVFLGLMIMTPLWTAAQQIDFQSDSASYVPGSPMRLGFEVHLPDSAEVLWPTPPDTFPGGLEILEVQPPEVRPAGKLKVYRRTWIAMAFAPDTFFVPPQQIRWRDAAGDTVSRMTNGLNIPVQIMAVDTAAALSALDPPLELPYGWNDYKYYLLALVLLAMVLYTFIYYYRLWKRKHDQAPVTEPMPLESPYVMATRELNALREEEAWNRMDGKAYYEKLTDVLRHYIQGRMGITALESTTGELQEKLARVCFAAELFPVQQLFQTADLAKFARYQSGPQEALQQLEAATAWIDAQEARYQAPQEHETVPADVPQKPIA